MRATAVPETESEAGRQTRACDRRRLTRAAATYHAAAVPQRQALPVRLREPATGRRSQGVVRGPRRGRDPRRAQGAAQGHGPRQAGGARLHGELPRRVLGRALPGGRARRLLLRSRHAGRRPRESSPRLREGRRVERLVLPPEDFDEATAHPGLGGAGPPNPSVTSGGADPPNPPGRVEPGPAHRAEGVGDGRVRVPRDDGGQLPPRRRGARSGHVVLHPRALAQVGELPPAREVDIEGEVDVEGFANHRHLRGTLGMDPLVTGTLPYAFRFTANDGAPYAFAGTRRSTSRTSRCP